MKRIRTLAALAVGWTILALGSAGAETIKLKNGNELDGKVLERTDDVLVLQHENLGRLEIPTSQLALETSKAGMFGTGFLRDWERRLEVGVNGAQGNSDFFNVLGGLSLGFENDYHRWAIEARYRLNEKDGEKSAHSAFASVAKDWLHPGRLWFPFLETRYDYDEFQDWDHRLSGTAGVGYTFLDRKRFELLGRAGLGASRTWGSEDERIAPEALLGLEGDWAIAERQKLSFYTKLFLDLAETGEYRNLSGAAWVIALNDELSLKLGAENRYESRVEGDAERNDLRYVGSLLIGF
jgi:putative salt-induced outer membrane protein YdiY